MRTHRLQLGSMSLISLKPLLVLGILFGVTSFPADLEDIKCPPKAPIQCPDTGACCELGQFCHSGLCLDCLGSKMSVAEQLIKCRKLNLKKISEELPPDCRYVCLSLFSVEEFNQYLQDQLNVLSQNISEVTNITSGIAQEYMQADKDFRTHLNDLKENVLLHWNDSKKQEIPIKPAEPLVDSTALSFGVVAFIIDIVIVTVWLGSKINIVPCRKEVKANKANVRQAEEELLPLLLNCVCQKHRQECAVCVKDELKALSNDIKSQMRNEVLNELKEKLDHLEKINLDLTNGLEEQKAKSLKLKRNLTELTEKLDAIKKANVDLTVEYGKQKETILLLRNDLVTKHEMEEGRKKLKTKLKDHEQTINKLKTDLTGTMDTLEKKLLKRLDFDNKKRHEMMMKGTTEYHNRQTVPTIQENTVTGVRPGRRNSIF